VAGVLERGERLMGDIACEHEARLPATGEAAVSDELGGGRDSPARRGIEVRFDLPPLPPEGELTRFSRWSILENS
jgi:hypothetical protein